MNDGQVGALVTVLAVLVAVLAVTVVLLVVRRARERRRDLDELAAIRAECAELERALARARRPEPTTGELVDGYLITDLGREAPVADRVVLSAVMGEPLVKLAAFAHGLRRGLSPETRHRIAFTVRREVKRSRKARRREMRAAWQEARRAEREAA